MTRKHIYIILILLCSLKGITQSASQIIFTHVSEDNGLSDNNVNCILKDSQELVWIGTEDGLNRIDGSTIKIFKSTTSDSTTLPSNKITILKEGENQDIWIGTDEGLSCYKKKENRFYNYSLVRSSYGGASNIVTGIIVDKVFIWIATDGGLIQLQPNTGQQNLILTEEKELVRHRKAGNEITSLIKDSAGILWFGTMDGLWSYNTGNHQLKKEISENNDPLYDPLNLSIADAGNELWIGTWNKGLKLYDKKKGSIKTFGNGGERITNITAASSPSKEHVLWLNGAFKLFDPDNKTFLKYTDLANEPNLHINTVYVSANKWVWFGTNAGLYIYNPQRQFFNNTVFKNNITSQSLVFANNTINVLVGGSNDYILKSYNDSFKELTNYHDLIFKNTPPSKTADALALIPENPQSWWLATSGGIVHINPQAGTNKWFVHKDGDSTSLPRNFITHIFIDKEKSLWVFPWREGVWQMDKTTGKCTRLMDGLGYVAGIKKKLVIADAAEDDAGNLWLADMDEGIIFYDRATGKFSKPFIAAIGTAPQTLRIYKKDSFFYSVANSLIIKWNGPDHCTVLHFPAEMNKKVYDFAPDKQGNWWFCTQNGLIYFNEEKNLFKRFTMADGLYTNELSATLFCSPAGKMIIGGQDFISNFLPGKLTLSAAGISKPLLTGFSVNGNEYNVENGKTITLANNENNILINWALPDYINPFKNNYYCMLKGIDSLWRYVGFQGDVQYANLSPGNYTVLLKAANTNGDMAPGNLELHITVHPPFWKTTWFVLSCLLVSGGILYYFISRRIYTIKAKAVIEKQMTELEMKALRAQMHPHFIFNSLNSIQECIVMNNTAAAYEYLGKFSKMVRRILENSGKLFVPLKEEIELLQWYVQLEQLRFKEPVAFSLTIDEDIDTANITLPAMIIQPYVENSLWHGLATKDGKKKLSVHFTQQQNYIECTITDNGVGRQATQIKTNDKKSMGMIITRERLQLFNQQAKVETYDLFNEDSTAAGTRIVIYLPTE